MCKEGIVVSIWENRDSLVWLLACVGLGEFILKVFSLGVQTNGKPLSLNTPLETKSCIMG